MIAWKRLLGAFFVLVLIDGALRKWVLPGQATLIYFLKDAVLIGSFGLYWLRHDTRLPGFIRGSFVGIALSAYVLAVVLEALNPHAPNFAVSLLGVKSHLLYLLLLVLVPAAFRASDDPMRWVRRYAIWAAVPISLLAIYQYFLPPTHWLNQYLSDGPIGDVATAGILGAARVTGTFSYITGMSTFVIFNFGMGAGLFAAGLRGRGRDLWLGAGLLALTLAVAPMTGSRGALYLPAVAVPIVLLALAGRGVFSGRLVFLAVLVTGAWVVLPTSSQIGAGWATFTERAQAADDEQSRVDDTLYGPLEKLDAAGFFGFGVGTTHQAAPQLAPNVIPYSWLPDLYFEEENGRIGLELGILGFAAYLALKLSLCVMAFFAVRRAEGEVELVFGVCAVVFFVSHLVAGTVFNPTAGAMYWGLAGAVFALWRGPRRAEGEQRVQRVNTYAVSV